MSRTADMKTMIPDATRVGQPAVTRKAGTRTAGGIEHGKRLSATIRRG
jgi:hypothetical protein